MTIQTKNEAFRELAPAEIEAVAGAGFEEPVDYPENGVYQPYQATQGIYIDPNTPQEIIPILENIIIGIFSNALYDLMTQDTTETVWTESAAGPGMSMNEVHLSNWFADVGQGNSPVTDYSSVHMSNVGDGNYIGFYTDSNGATNTFISQDTDHDGATDVVYMKDDSGTWWKATSTDSNGDPIWTPSEPPHLPTPDNVHG